MLGPRLILARMIDGPKVAWPPPLSMWVDTPAEAREAVRQARATGYDKIKVYSFLSEECYDAIIATARELKVDVIGHVPMSSSVEHVLDSGQKLIAHSEELAKHARGDYSARTIDSVATLMANHGVWMSPTLMTTRSFVKLFQSPESLTARPEVAYFRPPFAQDVWSYLMTNLYQPIPEKARDRIRDDFEKFQRPLTKAFHDRGGRLVIGSDALMKYLHERKTLDLEKIRSFVREADCAVCIDNVHGASRGRIERIIGSSSRVTYLRTGDDFLFGGVAPEPSEKNMAGVEEVLKHSKARFRLGAIIDPDGDRIRFSDGFRQIPMNYFGGMALHFLHIHKKINGVVAKSVGTSSFVNAIAGKLGIPVRETKVGFKHFRPYLLRRSAERAIVAFEESDGRLARLAHLAALQVPHLDGDALEGAAQHGQRAQQRRVTVAAHHLAGDRLGPEPQAQPQDSFDHSSLIDSEPEAAPAVSGQPASREQTSWQKASLEDPQAQDPGKDAGDDKQKKRKRSPTSDS